MNTPGEHSPSNDAPSALEGIKAHDREIVKAIVKDKYDAIVASQRVVLEEVFLELREEERKGEITAEQRYLEDQDLSHSFRQLTGALDDPRAAALTLSPADEVSVYDSELWAELKLRTMYKGVPAGHHDDGQHPSADRKAAEPVIGKTQEEEGER